MHVTPGATSRVIMPSGYPNSGCLTHQVDLGQTGYGTQMKIVIVGASGNIGSALLRELASSDHTRHAIVGVARRIPEVTPRAAELAAVRWESADIATSGLDPVLTGADVVVHL